MSSAKARVLGAGCAGCCELAVFHPIDTVAKRLMSNETATAGRLQQVVFRQHMHSGGLSKWRSLFPGFGFGAAYKITQRVYKFGGQPWVAEYLGRNHSAQLSTTMQQAISGSIMGVGEVLLLPLDALKIKAQ